MNRAMFGARIKLIDVSIPSRTGLHTCWTISVFMTPLKLIMRDKFYLILRII